VMAVSLNNGDTVWDTALASPHGRTELDRLVDIDSTVRVVGDNVFATGYQGRTAMLALDSGQIWWSHDMSSYRGLSVDDANIYVTQADGIIVAMRQRDGAELWRSDKVKHRALTAPAVMSTAIAVADFKGYMHFLDKNSGELVARVKVAKQRVSSQPVAVGDTVVVMTDGGSLAAFRAQPKTAAPAASAAPATEAAPTPSPQ
jgi:outer membrane protein assembly factor BamB